MEMNIIYETLGNREQHALASHISHMHEIYKEILGFINNDCLKDLCYYSFVPGRLRGVSQILFEIYERFEHSVNKRQINDLNVKKIMENFSIFNNLVCGLENAMGKFKYDYNDYGDLVKYTYALADFLQKNEFYVEDTEC